MRTVTVVVPVYWNEPSLPLLFAELRKLEAPLSERDLGLQLVFVDDGSGDGSLAELRKIRAQHPQTTIVKLARNFGAVHALKAGLQHVRGDCFTTLAADLQDPPELILEMVDRWRAGAKYVICTRAGRDDPPKDKLFSAAYYALLRLFVIPDFPRGGFDLALMDAAFLPHMRASAKNINPSLFAYWLGFRPEVIHYHRRARAHGRSRWTFSKKVKLFLDSLLGFSIVPIRTILLVGVAVSLLSFAYASFMVVTAALGVMPVRGFATTVSLLSFLLGLVIVMLGVIGEYVWRIFDEVSHRPEYVVDEISGGRDGGA